jgi:hypothetical protein
VLNCNLNALLPIAIPTHTAADTNMIVGRTLDAPMQSRLSPGAQRVAPECRHYLIAEPGLSLNTADCCGTLTNRAFPNAAA